MMCKQWKNTQTVKVPDLRTPTCRQHFLIRIQGQVYHNTGQWRRTIKVTISPILEIAARGSLRSSPCLTNVYLVLESSDIQLKFFENREETVLIEGRGSSFSLPIATVLFAIRDLRGGDQAFASPWRGLRLHEVLIVERLFRTVCQFKEGSRGLLFVSICVSVCSSSKYSLNICVLVSPSKDTENRAFRKIVIWRGDSKNT
jgi:hypothetical protein